MTSIIKWPDFVLTFPSSSNYMSYSIVFSTDANLDDAGQYKVEVSNAGGAAELGFGLKVVGMLNVILV